MAVRRLTETPLMEDARLFFRTKARVENMTMTMGPVHEWRTQVREKESDVA